MKAISVKILHSNLWQSITLEWVLVNKLTTTLNIYKLVTFMSYIFHSLLENTPDFLHLIRFSNAKCEFIWSRSDKHATLVRFMTKELSILCSYRILLWIHKTLSVSSASCASNYSISFKLARTMLLELYLLSKLAWILGVCFLNLPMFMSTCQRQLPSPIEVRESWSSYAWKNQLHNAEEKRNLQCNSRCCSDGFCEGIIL